jgi:hypothetical protein
LAVVVVVVVDGVVGVGWGWLAVLNWKGRFAVPLKGENVKLGAWHGCGGEAGELKLNGGGGRGGLKLGV